MRADPSVLILGEDVAEGGPWGATAGLAEEFGPSASATRRSARRRSAASPIGAAQSGLRPVVEIMFVDFVTLALDQLVNQAAKAHFMSGGQLTVPLVLRTQGGAGQRGAAQHSQSLEAWLTHVPGLKVVMPSTAADAAGLLASAIADPNPVVFVENKTLYFRTEDVPDEPEPVPIGRAKVVRPGRDVTVVALSRLVPESLAAADELAADGIEVEVVDPRTLVPLDLETIVESVARTHRLVVAHEAVVHGGFGAEIAAQVQEAAFDELDAPIERVGAPFAPVPFSPPLEDAYLPGSGDVAAAVRAVLGRDEGEPNAQIVLLAVECRSGDDRLARMSILGNRVLRKEDPRFLRGEATYVENLPLEGALTVTFVRSLLAHARIVGVDTSAAEALPDVQVFTGADIDVVDGPPPIPVLEQRMRRPVVAKDVVRFVGDIVAVVVSPDRATGADAAELVAVEYDPLPVAGRHGRRREGRGAALPGDRDERRRPRGPLRPRPEALRRLRRRRLGHARQPAHGRLPARGALGGRRGRAGRPDHRVALDAGAAPRSLRPRRRRSGSSPVSSRVIAPDVGGGFGAKSAFGAEETIVVWLARELGTPVRWTETRSESMITLPHGRGAAARAHAGRHARRQAARLPHGHPPGRGRVPGRRRLPAESDRAARERRVRDSAHRGRRRARWSRTRPR